MLNTAYLFILSDEIIYDIDVNLQIFHSPTSDKGNSNNIPCKTEIHHNSPYIALSTIPVIYDDSILDEEINIRVNDSKEHTTSLYNSIIEVKICTDTGNFEDKLIRNIVPTEDDLDEDIDIILKLIFSKTPFTEKLTKKYREMDKFSLRGNVDLEFKYLLFTFKDCGSLYHPSYYFNYSMKLLEFIRREHINRRGVLFPFLKKFILAVLNYFRSDGLFGPHGAISFYLYFHYKIHVRCLPIDITFDDEYHNSDEFLFMNFSFIENTISLTSQLALIWGYQSKCHKMFLNCVKNFDIKSQYGESLKIMELRLRESSGASKADLDNFTKFSREFFPNLIGAHPLSNQLLDYPISLNFIHNLMRLKALVVFPKDDKEVVKFSLPSSMLSNVSLKEFTDYPNDARYDFSNPQVGNYRLCVKQYLENSPNENDVKKQVVDIHQLSEPIITSFYGFTSLHITQFTVQYDFTKVDLHDLMYISVSKNNPYFVLEKGILYRGYNINTNKMKGCDKSKYVLVLAARDILTAEIPSSVAIISESAFENCRSLTRVTFEKNSLLKTIEDRAFFECLNLTEINFKDTQLLKKIGSNAFQYSGIQKVEFLEGGDLDEIGELAFSSCPKLKEVELPKNKDLSIKSFAFYKSPVTKLIIPEANSIYDFAFAKTKLTDVQLPLNLKYIGSYAFYKCSLKTFKIPSHVNFISSGIVKSNSELKEIEIHGNSPIFVQKIKQFGKIKFKAPVNQFHSLEELTNENFERKSENIENSQITELDDSFKLTDRLINKIIRVFSPDENLDKKFSKIITRIGPGAFMNASIKTFDHTFYEGGDISKLHRIYRFSFAYMQNLEKIDVSDSRIEYIPDYCFFHSSKLKEVYLPTTVKTIGRYAFSFTNLRKINLKNLINLIYIGDFAFYNTKMRQLVIPTSVEYIGSHFYSTKPYKVTMDVQDNDDNDDNEDDESDEEEDDENDDDENNEAEEIENDENENEEEEEANDDFDLDLEGEKQDDIIEINLEEEEDPEKEIECSIVFLKPSRLQRIECYAFYNSTVKKIVVPPSVKEIGAFAFAKCKYISQFKIPKNIRRIPDSAFQNSKIKEFRFQDINSITYIGSSAFSGTDPKTFDIPPNLSFISEYCFLNTIIEMFNFKQALKVHEIKQKAFENPTISIDFPLAATEKTEDSYELAGARNCDFVGEYAKEVSDKKFEGFDEITFNSQNRITIKKEEYNPYVTPKEEVSNFRGIDIFGKYIKLKNPKKPINLTIVQTSKENVFKESYDKIISTSKKCNAVIQLYYEIASKQITHISFSYSDSLFEKNNSILFEIDQYTDKVCKCFNDLVNSLNVSFLHEEEVEIFNNFFKCNTKSHYSPANLYKETQSICNALKIKIPKRISLVTIDSNKAVLLTTLTTVSLIYLDILSIKKNDFEKRGAVSFIFGKLGSYVKLRRLAKDDYFELDLMYDTKENLIVTKQILNCKSLTNNKFFDLPFYFVSSQPSFDPDFQKIAVTYNFSLSYSIRNILDGILKKNIVPGQLPYKYFMKLQCIVAYIQIFRFCAEAKYTLANISSKTLFLSESFDPLFIFIQRKENDVYDINCELKRFWLLIYEIITNQSIDHLMEKVVNGNEKSIQFDKLQIRTRDLDEFVLLNDSDNKAILYKYINQKVYGICFNPEKFQKDVQFREQSFFYLFNEFQKMWRDLKLDGSNDKSDFESYLSKVQPMDLKIKTIPDIKP